MVGSLIPTSTYQMSLNNDTKAPNCSQFVCLLREKSKLHWTKKYRLDLIDSKHRTSGDCLVKTQTTHLICFVQRDVVVSYPLLSPCVSCPCVNFRV